MPDDVDNLVDRLTKQGEREDEKGRGQGALLQRLFDEGERADKGKPDPWVRLGEIEIKRR